MSDDDEKNIDELRKVHSLDRSDTDPDDYLDSDDIDDLVSHDDYDPSGILSMESDDDELDHDSKNNESRYSPEGYDPSDLNAVIRKRDSHDSDENLHTETSNIPEDDINPFDDLETSTDTDHSTQKHGEDTPIKQNDRESVERVSELRKLAHEKSQTGQYTYLDDDDITDDLAYIQSTVNRNSRAENSPKMTRLMDDPLPYGEEAPIDEAVDPGDSKSTRKIAKIFASALGGIAIIAIMIVALAPRDHAPEVTRGQSVVAGEQIDNNKNKGDNTQDQPQRKETKTNTNVVVPKGGSKTTYEMTAEGDIKGVSISWLDGNGIPDSQIDASLPFSKTVGMKPSVSPTVKANSSGYGTLTCKIKKNGKTISEQTVSGDSPTIQCEG